MPYCPECKSEYQAGITTCTECQVPLVEELPAEEETASPFDGWVKVSSDHAETEAYVIQGFLENEGIECQLENATFHAEPTLATTLVNIWVREEDEERARSLLSERWSIAQCLNCGAFCSPAEKVCPSCGEKFESEVEGE